MKEQIALKAKELGFTPKTVTTKYTFDYLLGGKNMLINDTCIYLLFAEIQKWLREVYSYDIFVVVSYTGEVNHQYSYYITAKQVDTDTDGCNTETYQEALQIAILEGLELISEEN